MVTVDDVDEDDIAAEQFKVQKFTCVNKSSKYSCHLHNDAPCLGACSDHFESKDGHEFFTRLRKRSDYSGENKLHNPEWFNDWEVKAKAAEG